MTRTTRIVAVRREVRRQRTLARTSDRGFRWQIPVVGTLATSALATVALAGLFAASTVGVMSTGLPDPKVLGQMGFAQATVLYDRTGKTELGRFQDQKRRVVEFKDVPTVILDATTAAEDRTFWDNAGVDVPALISAAAENASGTSERGASTITQQLVRARFLPEDIVGPGSDRYVRKVKEMIQSLRLNDAFPGE